MANKKISELPAASAVSGTEVVPVVQDGETRKATVTDLHATSLQKTQNLNDLPDKPTARANLGLGSAATQSTSAFDAAGAAANVQNLALLKANNLSDIPDKAAARANLEITGGSGGLDLAANYKFTGQHRHAKPIMFVDEPCMVDAFAPYWLGHPTVVPVGDGTLRLLSDVFGSLAAAQALYPFVTALTQSLDWAVMQAAANAVRTASGTFATMAGVYQMSPRRMYRIKDTVVWGVDTQRTVGLTIAGGGRYSTRVVWDGPAGGCLLRTKAAHLGVYRDFALTSTVYSAGTRGLWHSINQLGSGGASSTFNQRGHDIYLDNFETGIVNGEWDGAAAQTIYSTGQGNNGFWENIYAARCPEMFRFASVNAESQTCKNISHIINPNPDPTVTPRTAQIYNCRGICMEHLDNVYANDQLCWVFKYNGNQGQMPFVIRHGRFENMSGLARIENQTGGDLAGNQPIELSIYDVQGVRKADYIVSAIPILSTRAGGVIRLIASRFTQPGYVELLGSNASKQVVVLEDDGFNAPGAATDITQIVKRPVSGPGTTKRGTMRVLNCYEATTSTQEPTALLPPKLYYDIFDNTNDFRVVA